MRGCVPFGYLPDPGREFTLPHYDVVGVGFGPANLALAIALEENFPDVSAHFLEASSATVWQQQMMLERANIQHAPFNDLVTHRNPRSRYSFICYLYEHDRLFQHFDLHLRYPLRLEYAKYVEWVAGHFDHVVSRNAPVRAIAMTTVDGEPCYAVDTENAGRVTGRVLVLGSGRTPYIPPLLAGLPTGSVVHLTQYLSAITGLVERIPDGRVAIIGSGQSAVEIIIDLAKRYPRLDLVNYIRHFAYKLKDTNPFMEACIYPRNIKPFYGLSWSMKRRFLDDIRYVNYSAADMDVLEELYLMFYEADLDGREPPLTIINNSEISDAEMDGTRVRITSRDIYTGARSVESFDLVVAATGFRDLGPGAHQERMPPLLRPLADRYRMNELGFCHVNLDYSLEPRDEPVPPAFLNGLCESTHGMADAGTFSLLSLRAKTLSEAIVDRLRTHGDRSDLQTVRSGPDAA